MKALKWIGSIVGGLIVLFALVAMAGAMMGDKKLTQSFDYTPENLTIPTDTEAVARGQALVEHLMLCADCHGPDLGGQEFFKPEDGAGTLWAPNLTQGNGGIGSAYTDADWVRALRHGIRPNGEVLLIMPSEIYTHVALEDMANIIAYLKSLPPVDRTIPQRDLAFMPKVMLGLGAIPAEEFLPAHHIDHAAIPPAAPARGVTVAYGQYMALVCSACHGDDLAGMPADPDSGSIAAPNLTPGGELANWTEADFLTTLRTGVTPGGENLDPMQMPWQRLGGADVEDLQAIWMYLQSLPSTPTNN